MENIFQEYNNTIETSTWMDESTKMKALHTASKMSRHIGYDVKLTTEEADDFYADLPELSQDNFLETGLAFTLFTVERKYRNLFPRKNAAGKIVIAKDWTK